MGSTMVRAPCSCDRQLTEMNRRDFRRESPGDVGSADVASATHGSALSEGSSVRAYAKVPKNVFHQAPLGQA